MHDLRFLSNSADPHPQILPFAGQSRLQECLSNAKCHKAARGFISFPSGLGKARNGQVM